VAFPRAGETAALVAERRKGGATTWEVVSLKGGRFKPPTLNAADLLAPPKQSDDILSLLSDPPGFGGGEMDLGLSPPPSFARPVPGATGGGPSDPLVATLQKAGFKGEALKTAWAIAKRESGGRATAYNPNRGTGDDSYGLFQINMLGNLGPARRKQYGLKSNEDLYDPATNARVAYAMSKGGTDFGAWGYGPNRYRDRPPLDFSGWEQAVKVKAPPRGTKSLAPIDNVLEGSGIGAQAVRQAATQLGDPYLFGATSVGANPKNFDCSSLVQWSYAQLGIKIPRDTWGQQKALPLKSWSDLRPGDPIYRKSGGHVVIYAGGGKVIAAPHTGTVVQYQPLTNFPPGSWEVRSISR
jgi:cell wall-associated NlpC family hydrolase